MSTVLKFTFRLWLVASICIWSGLVARAATSTEQSAFNLAEKALNNSSYPQAEKFFSDFLTKFPSSELKLNAFFDLAQARYWQSNYTGALLILQTNLPSSGTRSNEFLKWMGDSAQKIGNFDEAAGYLERLAVGDSIYASEATLNLANLLFAKREYSRASEVLKRRFIAGKDALPNLELIGKAEVLLNKIILQQRESKKPVALLLANPRGQISSELLTDIYFTRGRVDLQNNDIANLHENTSNLLAVAANPAYEPARLMALYLQGAEAFQSTNFPVALTNFTALAEQPIVPWLQGMSLNYFGAIKAQQGDLDAAIKYFADFTARMPGAPGLNLARLNLADFYLKKFALLHGPAGLLQASLTNLQSLKLESLEPADQGRKRMLEGWIFIQNGNREQALAAFTDAAGLVQDLVSRQVVLHKLADTRF
ncbi:MAG: hypothetical protein JWM04_2044, partial [Verrucomicrobiales bacterium]|nr:hypothetical protein [Verrucomicrobiales bacterium]